MDQKYVVELFDYYAATYDEHMKDSLLYTAPRILRQEVRKVFNRTLQQEEGGRYHRRIAICANRSFSY